MRYFFVGMPASGKSVVAKEFAKQINTDFIDLDEYIELKYSQTIPKIFEIYGEVKFREFENLALKEIIKSNNVVLATGGGTPCFYNNMQLMNDVGKTIYLKVPEEILYERILEDNNIRPLVLSMSRKEMKKYLIRTLKKREKFYMQADRVIDGNKHISEILCNI